MDNKLVYVQEIKYLNKLVQINVFVKVIWLILIMIILVNANQDMLVLQIVLFAV